MSMFAVYTSTDDDIDADNLHDEELQMYFSKLIPPAMQRGRVEGQEIPAAVCYWCINNNYLLTLFLCIATNCLIIKMIMCTLKD